jgi:hypothetical protein
MFSNVILSGICTGEKKKKKKKKKNKPKRCYLLFFFYLVFLVFSGLKLSLTCCFLFV